MQQSHPNDPMSMHSPTLLVIEDGSEQAVQVSAAARCARAGLAVHTAKDGLDGISYLAGTPPFEDRRRFTTPSLVLLNLNMSEVDGFEVLTWIRGQGAAVNVPVVVLTASPSVGDEKRARSLGAREIHSKPGAPDELTELIRSIVDRWIDASEMIGAHMSAMG